MTPAQRRKFDRSACKHGRWPGVCKECEKPEFTPAEVAFIRDEMYGAMANGADDPIFKQIHDKAELIVRWNNATRRASVSDAGAKP